MSRMEPVPFTLMTLFLISMAPLADAGAVSIPAGNPSALQDYLCNGLSHTTLELQRGVHVITRKGFCIASTGLTVRIIGTGKHETTVTCAGNWGFGFSYTQSITIEGLAFVNCGAISDQMNRSAVLYWNFVSSNLSPSISLNNVAFHNSSGFGVVGNSQTKYTVMMSDVDFGGCSEGSICLDLGAYFDGRASMLSILRCSFVGLGALPVEADETAGLTVRGCVANIQDCSFRKNRGGALYVTESSVNVYDSSFVDNFAQRGAAINATNMISLNVISSRFENNIVYNTGGAIRVRGQEQVSSPIFQVHNCSFRNNTAEVGGAVFVHDLETNVEISRSAFVSNKACFGAAIYAGDAHEVFGKDSYNVQLIDVAVIENECIRCSSGARGAAVYLSEINYLNITGNPGTGSDFIRNYPQGAIQGIGANLHLFGAVSFKNNSGENGGAIYLTNDGHLYFSDGCVVNFAENTASRLGGAIYIEGDQSIVTSFLTYCAVHFLGWNHNITFKGNHANLAGHAIYATPIYDCDLDNKIYPNLKPQNQKDYYKFYKIGDSEDNQILSFPVNINLCGSCKYRGTYGNTNHTYPGAKLWCNATLSDYANTTSPGVVFAQVVLEGENAVSPVVRLAPQQEVQWIASECTTIEYQIYGPQNVSVTLQLLTKLGTNLYQIPMTLQACEDGFALQNDFRGLLQCECSKFLSSFGVTCNVNHGTVSSHEFQWIGLDPDGNEAVSKTCPLKYCNENIGGMTLARLAGICAGGRIGVLCGQCPSGLSVVFGSEECLKCSNIWLLTILMYAGLGALLVAALFALNITVTSRILYGPIFYANVLVVNASIFFSQSGLAPLEIPVSLMNLDLGFPLCFFDGMNDLAKMGFQFVFPAYLLVIAITIVITSHYCLTWSSTNTTISCVHRVRRSIGKRAVNVLATLIYLSYSKVLQTVIDILTYTTVCIENGTTITVWFYDGTIKFLHGNHIVLFLLAMVASVFLFFYTLALTFIPIIEVCSEKHKVCTWLNRKVSHLKPMNDAYYGPYKGEWRIWLGARLWLVVLLYSIRPSLGADNPSLLLSIHVILVIIFMFIQIHIMPFEGARQQEPGRLSYISKYIYNWLDLFYLLNYAILALIVSYLLVNDTNRIQLKMVVGTFVGIALLLFFCTIIVRMVLIFCKKCGRSHSSRSGTSQLLSKEGLALSCSSSPIGHEDKLREPLLDESCLIMQAVT